MNQTSATANYEPALIRGRSWRDGAIVLVLTICIQLALYWPSFTGSAVLLPLNILTRPGIYLPADLNGQPLPNYGRSDLVQVSEPHRWFISAEYRAGRIPLWTPYAFTGTPFTRAPIFSPFELLYVLWPSPRVLPWIQMATAIVAALGAWFCAARLLKLGSLSAITAGVVYPMTGFLVLWQGYDLSYPVVFFPLQILAALGVLEKPTIGRIVGLAIATALTLISGPIDMAAMVLLSTGMLWSSLLLRKWLKERSHRSVALVTAATGFGWALGFLLAAPGWMATLDYVKSGMRLSSRAQGAESRPPIGWTAIPLIAFPEAFGTEKDDTIFVHESGVRLESSAGAYCGSIGLILAIPWALVDRSRRSWVVCLIGMTIIGLSWQVNIPGFVSVWRLPGIRALSANRMVFVSAWSMLMLAAVGLEQLQQASISRRWPSHVSLCLSLCGICLCIAGTEYWHGELRRLLPGGQPGLTLSAIRSSFLAPYWRQTAWLGVALLLSAGSLIYRRHSIGMALTLAAAMAFEPFLHVRNLHPQPDPQLYYPRLPALEFIQRSAPGRALGVHCLPPKLLESHGVQDIRGYDGVDPFAYIQLVSLAADIKRTGKLEYARTMWYFPELHSPEDPRNAFRLHPVLDMLGLRYIIFSEPTALPNPAFQGDGYSVFINSHAMPRAWVPGTVSVVKDPTEVLKSMFSWGFRPSSQAYLTSGQAEVPEHGAGTVEVVDQHPQKLSLTAKMETAGLVVVGDRYDADWHVTVDGVPQSMLCVNYALRGVVVPAGVHKIEMDYRPIAFAWGVRMFVLAFLILSALAAYRSLQMFFLSRSR